MHLGDTMAKRGRKRLLEGQEGRVCHFYYDTDMSVVAIARRFDVSAGVINRILEEHGKTCELPRPTGGFRRLKRTGLPASRSGACSGMRRSSGAALHRLGIGRFPPYHIFSPMENVFFCVHSDFMFCWNLQNNRRNPIVKDHCQHYTTNRLGIPGAIHPRPIGC